MKKKITKIWGIGLAVALLVMLIGAAIPVSAGTLAWSPVGTPNPLTNQLQTGTNVDALAIAPDGTTMFAYDNVGTLLYKSTDAGKTWTTTAIGDTLETNTVVAMAISPDYATDATVVAATAGKVFRSINGGKSFGEVGTDVGALIDAGSTVTSIDVSPYYLGGTAIIVGDADVTPAITLIGGVSLFTTSSLAWTPLNTTALGWAAGGENVSAVAFSPNHLADAQILALSADASDTYLRTKFGTDIWNAGVLAAKITGEVATGGVIAFPDDYEWSANNRVMVGIATSGTAGDVYRIHGALPGGSSIAYDLNVDGTGTNTAPVTGLAVKGAIVEADVLVGQADTGTIKRCTDPTTSTVTWRSSTKSPTGASCTALFWSPTTDDAYTATTGVGSAFSRSTDGGVTWNQLALIDVSSVKSTAFVSWSGTTLTVTSTAGFATPAGALYVGTPGTATYETATYTGTTTNTFTGITLTKTQVAGEAVVAAHVQISGVTVLDANTMYMLMYDDADGDAAVSTGDYTMVFKTTDGGSSWEQIWTHRSVTTERMTFIVPAGADTIFVAQNDTRLWKTTNGGQTFIGLTAPAAITALGVVDASTYYTGHIAAVYKSGRWTASTGVTDTVTQFAIAGDGTIFIGTNDGDVQQSTNDAGKFTTLGSAQTLGAGANVLIALDPDYASNNYIYAGSSTATVGVNRWTVGTSTAWKQLDDDTNTLACSGVRLSADGSLYAASATADKGVRRSVAPQGPSAAAWAFEPVTTDLLSGAQLSSLGVGAGSNVLYAVANHIAGGGYGYNYRVITFTDNLAVSPALSAPKDGTITPGTSVTLGWKAVDSPVSLTYTYEISTDTTFSVYAGGTPDTVIKSGTGVSVTGLTSGTKYYWKVYVSSPLLSKDSAVWTFTPQLSVTGTTSLTTAPEPGATDVSLRPVFQWASVPKATSYELELADNAFYANASVKKPLTHTVWTWDTDLEYATTYYWRVRAVAKGLIGSWSEATFTTMAEPVVEPPVVIPPPVITVQPTPVPPITIPPAPPSPVTPAIIWAIIIIGAVLVIAVIVLIVRTRRVP